MGEQSCCEGQGAEQTGGLLGWGVVVAAAVVVAACVSHFSNFFVCY